MSEFSVYFQLGVFHIMDINAYDHMLFLLALCGLYTWVDYKKLLLLVTAFTVGHSLSLAAATIGWISANASVIEFLIPVTIFVTALANFFPKAEDKKQSMFFKYLLTGGFGLIHGLGFSNYLRSLLGKEESLLWPLFSFNLGVEAGQVIIVSGIVLGISALSAVIKEKRELIQKLISGFAVALSLVLMYETKFW